MKLREGGRDTHRYTDLTSSVCRKINEREIMCQESDSVLCVCVCVCVCVCEGGFCVYGCVCVCERERERGEIWLKF